MLVGREASEGHEALGKVEGRMIGSGTSSGSASGIIFRRRKLPMDVLGANRFPTRCVLEAVLWILNTGAGKYPRAGDLLKTLNNLAKVYQGKSSAIKSDH